MFDFFCGFVICIDVGATPARRACISIAMGETHGKVISWQLAVGSEENMKKF